MKNFLRFVLSMKNPDATLSFILAITAIYISVFSYLFDFIGFFISLVSLLLLHPIYTYISSKKRFTKVYDKDGNYYYITETV